MENVYQRMKEVYAMSSKIPFDTRNLSDGWLNNDVKVSTGHYDVNEAIMKREQEYNADTNSRGEIIGCWPFYEVIG